MAASAAELPYVVPASALGRDGKGALGACRTYLLLNRASLEASQQSKVAMCLRLAAGVLSESALVAWGGRAREPAGGKA